MNKETLIKTRNMIIEILKEADIEPIEKLELIINTDKFLENYEENIKILTKHRKSNQIGNN